MSTPAATSGRPRHPGVIQRRRHHHRLPPAHRPARSSRVRDLISVVANVNVGAVTTPPTHTACVSAGATGVTASHDDAGNVPVHVAVAASTRHPPGGSCPHPNPSGQLRRHRHRRPASCHHQDSPARAVDDPRRLRQRHRRRRTAPAAHVACDTPGATGTTGIHATRRKAHRERRRRRPTCVSTPTATVAGHATPAQPTSPSPPPCPWL